MEESEDSVSGEDRERKRFLRKNAKNISDKVWTIKRWRRKKTVN